MTADPAAPGTATFTFTWDDPADAELTWELDDMHNPFPMAPLTADYARAVIGGFGYRFARLDAPYRALARVWNGYLYTTVVEIDPAVSEGGPAESPDAAAAAYLERKRDQARIADAYWRDSARPEMERFRDWFRSIDVPSMSAEEVAAAWEHAWALTDRAWSVHMYCITGAYQVTDDLSDFYEAMTPDASPGEALSLIGGHADELHAVECGLDRLTDTAAASPAVRDAIAGGAARSVEDLQGLDGAEAFITELASFLDDHGHLGGSFDDLAYPSWAEAPELLLGDLGKRLTTGGPDAEERRARVRRDGEALAATVRSRLAGRPDDLARFEELLATAFAAGPLTETHNYWIDRLVQACLRTFALQVGDRLVTSGVIGDRTDVLYLARDEIGPLLLAPADRSTTVSARRAEHDRQRAMPAPRVVGRPPETSETGRFDGARYEADDDGTLRGTGASAGHARGVARLVLGPEDFARVEQGDIVVAPSSNPSWLPLFTIAGGLLTNTGGVLSHAAVVAREYGLPAVVGLGDATSRIADGSIVELDGSTGRVRML